jgi:hypothetical protein
VAALCLRWIGCRNRGVAGRSTRSLAVMKSFRVRPYVACVLLATSCSAAAMSCFRMSDGEIVITAGTAFVGNVLSVDDSPYETFPGPCRARTTDKPHCGAKLVTLHVIESLRGKLDANVTVRTMDSCTCLGPSLTVGSSYVVVARPNRTGEPGDYVAASICGGTEELNERGTGLVKAFRAGRP